VGQGLQNTINEQLGSLGGNTITISPGYSKASGQGGPGGGPPGLGTVSSNATLGRNDVQALKGIPEIAYIDTNIQGSADVIYMDKSAKISITGVDQSVWSYVTTASVSKGRLLGPADQNVVVIGYGLANDYFSNPIEVNKAITIEGKSFRVVGILEDSSSSNNAIYMPIQSAYSILADKTKDKYDSITVVAKDGTDIDSLVAKIEKKLDAVRHVNTENDKDFTVTSMKQIQNSISSISSTLTLFLGGIAAISLTVGAVGIANTMFTAVLEKTKEIGIMKAIGARNRDILLIFLFNAGVVGIIGGIIGVTVGVLASSLITILLGGALKTAVSPEMILLALSVSLFVGIVAGLVPAYQGSKLKPVDALRYE
jgi:putative ABC transport system permease protein